MRTEPEEYLHSLSQQVLPLLGRFPRAMEQAAFTSRLLATSSQLQAVANAFVVLGLVDEQRAEEILYEHRVGVERFGIELHGVATGELTLVPGSAHRMAEARRPQPEELADQPLGVAVPWCRLGDVELHSLVLTPSGLRGQVTLRSSEPRRAPSSELLSELSITDESGRRHSLAVTASQTVTGPLGSYAQLSVQIEEPTLAGTAWLDISSPQVTPLTRVRFAVPPSLPTGIAEPVLGTPAERYLAWLAPDLAPLDPNGTVGMGLSTQEAAELVIVVADALLAVGALPPDSTILAGPPPSSYSWWQYGLAQRWSWRLQERLRQGLEPHVIALGTRLPFDKAIVAVEWLAVIDETAIIELFAVPRSHGEYWPVAVGGFHLHAIDDAGIEHKPACTASMLGTVLWPPMGPQVRRLRVEVSTLWEAAWVELELPERDNEGRTDRPLRSDLVHCGCVSFNSTR